MRFLKEMKWDAIMMGALNIILGVVALVLPETMERTLAYLIGVVLILAGAVSMICYLIRDARQNYYHNDFAYGLLGVALGCVVLYKVDAVIGMISAFLGFLVLFSGFNKLQDVIDMKRLGYNNWVAMLVLAILNVVAGLILLCYPFKAVNLLFRIMGISLLVSGATDIGSTLFFAGKIAQFLKAAETAIEADAVETAVDSPDAAEDGQKEDERAVDWDSKA